MVRLGRLQVVGSVLVAVAFLAVSVMLPAGIGPLRGAARADTSAVTVTGGYAWDWQNTSANFTDPSTVTVTQTTNLTDQTVHVTWTNFSPSNSQAFGTNVDYVVGIYECQGHQVTTPIQCEGTSAYDKAHAVNNVTDTNLVQTFTSGDGTGAADIGLRTSATDTGLGCDDKHACSIVVVPNWGGRVDIDSTTGKQTLHCDDHSFDSGAYADSQYLDAGCSWSHRIVVPVSFARGASVCDRGDSSFDAAGSPMLGRAMDLWRSKLCDGADPNRVGYVSNTNEYAARRDFLSGRNDVGLTTQPATETPAGGRKVEYAPLANSAIAITYYADNANTGQPITDLKLNARLVAKLLTQSYSSSEGCTADSATQQIPCAPEVTGNPRTIFADPEFLQLNPQYHVYDFAGAVGVGAAYPVVYGSDSDMTWELTRWIESDPDARQFLNGDPDQWGMRVNKFYLPSASGKYPISAFRPNDPGAIHHLKKGTGDDSCQGDYACDALGIQALWNPVSSLDKISQLMLGGKSSALSQLGSCGFGDGGTIVHGFCASHNGAPPDPVGQRGVFAVVPASDAESYGFPTAQLETTPGHFVGPTRSAITAALSTMRTNPDGVTQYVDHSRSTDAAYPLTMTDYAMVPTCGLGNATAAKVAQFLTYVGSDKGQEYGTLPGQLAPGYAELSDPQRANTAKAAAAVGGQTCATAGGHESPPSKSSSGGDHPPTGGSGSGGNPPSGGSGGPSGNGGGDNGGGGGSGDNGGGSGDNGAGPDGNTPHGLTNNPNVQPSQDVAFGKADPDQAGLTRIMLPVLLIVGGVLLLGGPAALVLGGTDAGATVLRRARSLLRRG